MNTRREGGKERERKRRGRETARGSAGLGNKKPKVCKAKRNLHAQIVF